MTLWRYEWGHGNGGWVQRLEPACAQKLSAEADNAVACPLLPASAAPHLCWVSALQWLWRCQERQVCQQSSHVC